MIVHRTAAAALLLLSSRPPPIRGAIPPTKVTMGRSSTAASEDVGSSLLPRQLKKDDADESKCHSKSGKDCDDGEDVDAEDAEKAVETEWPTYAPVAFSTRSPSPSRPQEEENAPTPLHGNCDPIGSRTSFDRPVRSNPIDVPSPPSASPSTSPLPKIDADTPAPNPAPNGSGDDLPALPLLFRRGNLVRDIERYGFKVNSGMFVSRLARANFKVTLKDRSKSMLRFHAMPDGAAVIPLGDDGGYVYVSNSEVPGGKGGVYGIYFDAEHDVIDYKALLEKTTRNCSGGTTPWGTFVSCEEYGSGQCWQVDPDPKSKHHSKPEVTRLGGEGGNYESVACDDTNPSQPIFFVTEDHVSGALRRYTPPEAKDDAGWDSLHMDGGVTRYLVFLDDQNFVWSCDEALGRWSQERHYPNLEGINYQDGKLYFVSKKLFQLYVLDLDAMTYEASSTRDPDLYLGEFGHQPDQVVRNGEEGKLLYFTEDGGDTPGVYAIDSEGDYYAIVEAYGKEYRGDETTGLAFSPDGTRMFVAFQDCGCEESGEIDCGCLYSFRRADGRSFDGSTLGLKYHSGEERRL